MENKKIKIIIWIGIVIVLLAWAPWLLATKVHDKVLREKGRIDHTIDEKGNVVCDYGVIWVPFGRFVASCEGGWFVTFWGHIL